VSLPHLLRAAIGAIGPLGQLGDRDYPLTVAGAEQGHALGRAPGDADVVDRAADELVSDFGTRAAGEQPVDDEEQRCRRALQESDLRGAFVDGSLTVRTAPDSFYGLAARAVGSARHQRSELAHIAMGELVQRHYRSDAVLPYLGWAMLLEGEGEAAEMFLREALRLRPDSFTLQVMLGWVLLGMQKSRSALSHASRLLHQHPESGVARLLAAYAYHESSRAREALDLFASVPEGPLRGRRYWLEVAESARRLNRTDLFEQAVAKLRGERFDIRVWCSLGGEALNAGRLDEARMWFEEAVEHGHYPEALHGLLFLAVRENRNEEADGIATRMLNLEIVRPHDAAHPMTLLPAVVGIMSSLQPPIDDAQTFIGRYPLAADLPLPVDVEWMELMIAARSQPEAEKHGAWLWRALFPSHPVPPAQIKPAAGHQQSDGATHPGIIGRRFVSKGEA